MCEQRLIVGTVKIGQKMYNPIDAKLQQLSGECGIDEVTLKLALCLFASFPLNGILKRLPDSNTRLKCYFIVTVSAFYIFGVLNLYDGFRTLFISTMFTYVITRFYQSRFMPYVNFVFVMGHLALNHMHAQFYATYDPTKVDITGAQMVLVMKLTSFGWSYYDGTLADKKTLTEYQLSRSVSKHPSILQFMAYAFFYPSLLTGPSFDYADFESWLNCEIFRDLPESKKPRRKWAKDPNKRRQIPKSAGVATVQILKGIFWLVLSFAIKDRIYTGYIFTEEFLQKPFLYRIHYFFLLGFSYRLKYYAAWTISEASCIVCGLGYNGYDTKLNKIKWNRVQNIDIWRLEMAQNTHESLEAWNMNTNKWLKNYVYLRVARKGSKPGFRSTLFTFLTSAFWHGTRPGYYLTFATGALFQTCGKLFRRNFRPIFLDKDGKTPLKSKVIYDALSFYLTKISFGYLVQPFVILDFKKSLYGWKTVNFYIHIGILLTFFSFMGPFSKPFVNWLKNLQPMQIELRRQKKLESEIAATAGTLGSIINEKHAFEKDESELELENAVDLGIPSVDFDKEKLDEARAELKEFMLQYEEWRNEKGLEVEEENLRRAYENFTKEFQPQQRRMSFSSYSPTPIKKKD